MDEGDPVGRIKKISRIMQTRDHVNHMVNTHIGRAVDGQRDRLPPSSDCGEVAPYGKWTGDTVAGKWKVVDREGWIGERVGGGDSRRGHTQISVGPRVRGARKK